MVLNGAGGRLAGSSVSTPFDTAAAGLPAVTVSTPGKLILMGEHAVVYGRPALVAAIDLRLRARFGSPASARRQGPEKEEVQIDLPALGHRVTASWAEVLAYARAAREGWAAYAARPGPASFRQLRGEDPAHVVKVALGEVAAAWAEEPGRAPRLRLRLDSELPIGAGFGSSAAAAVAVVAGYAAWRGGGDAGGGHGAQDASGALDLATIERLALEAERRQHGLPSGVDTATSLYGGLLWAQRLSAAATAAASAPPPAPGAAPAAMAASGAMGAMSAIAAMAPGTPAGTPGLATPSAAMPAGPLVCERLAATSPLLGRLRVYHTGTPPEPTGAVVAAVRARRDRDPAAHERLFERMEAVTRALRCELGLAAERPPLVVEWMREHQACLEELGVVPAPVRELVRQVEAAGGAAKISGAGSLAGPGAGSLLVYHPDPELAAGWDFLRPFPHHPVHLGAAGFRREIA
jgi:mevalonate kinase